MAKKRNRKSKRRNRKQTGQTSHASLAGFAPLIESKGIFDKIHQQVLIGQKQLIYRPTDKLIFVVLGLFVGCEHIDEINHRLRADKVLYHFGFQMHLFYGNIRVRFLTCSNANINKKRVVAVLET